MTDQCPYLEYRPLSGDGGASEDGEAGERDRAYCTAADQFVQPMRADICNDRYGLDHESDCEIYRDHEGLPEMPDADVTASSTPGGTNESENSGGTDE